MKIVHCPCGTDVEGETDDAIVENVEAHIAVRPPGSRRQVLERSDPGDGARALIPDRSRKAGSPRRGGGFLR